MGAVTGVIPAAKLQEFKKKGRPRFGPGADPRVGESPFEPVPARAAADVGQGAAPNGAGAATAADARSPPAGRPRTREKAERARVPGGDGQAQAATRAAAAKAGQARVDGGEAIPGQGSAARGDGQARSGKRAVAGMVGEARAFQARPVGVGDEVGVKRREAHAAAQEAAGAGGCLGASTGDAVRERVDQGRREKAARLGHAESHASGASASASSMSGNARLPARPLAGEIMGMASDGNAGSRGSGREEVAVGLARLMGSALDNKPRPFANVVGMWGGGSCFINAGLQVLFASEAVQAALARVVRGVRRAGAEEAELEELLRFTSRASVPEIKEAAEARALARATRRPAEARRVSVPGGCERALAVTLAVAMQGRVSGGDVPGLHFYPSPILRHYYMGEQEDAVQFLMLCLGDCPRVLALFRGRFTAAELECGRCGHRWPAGSGANERDFTRLEVAPRCWETNAEFRDVQEAVEKCTVEPLVGFRTFCACCASEQRMRCKVRAVEVAPRVLLVEVQQWDNSQQRVHHNMAVNEILHVAGHDFSLRGLVLHRGGSPRGGHYVAVARHGRDSEPYYLYNDRLRVSQARDTIASVMRVRNGSQIEPFYVSALLYERVDDAVDIRAANVL